MLGIFASVGLEFVALPVILAYMIVLLGPFETVITGQLPVRVL